MKRLQATIAAACLVTVTAWGAGASAGEAGHALRVAERIFTLVDEDKDGAMTRDEYAKGGLGRYGAEFGDFDLDADGRVTLAEYRTVFARYHSGARQDAI